MVAGVRVISGGAVTISVTVVVCGVLVAPAPAIVINPVYVPGGILSPDAFWRLTLTVTMSISPVELPLTGDMLNHVAPSLTDQFSVPPPLLLIASV